MIISIFFTLVLLYILYAISREDITSMLISENKLKIFALSGFFYLICLGSSSEKVNSIDLIINNSLSMINIFLIMYSINYISLKLIQINSLGLGDVKFSSISAIWLGFELTLISIYISFLLSAIYSLHGKINKKFKMFHQYPFAPFISIGILCSWILDKV